MDIHMRHETNVTIITLTGKVTPTARKELRDCFDDVLAKSAHNMILHLDINDSDIDPAVADLISDIVQMNMQSESYKTDGTTRRVLVVVTPDMSQVFELMNASSILECYDTVENALQSLAHNTQ